VQQVPIPTTDISVVLLSLIKLHVDKTQILKGIGWRRGGGRSILTESVSASIRNDDIKKTSSSLLPFY